MQKKDKDSITNQSRADRLVKMRLDRGLTQPQVADGVGLSLPQYQKYEYAQVGIDEDTINPLAIFYGVILLENRKCFLLTLKILLVKKRIISC